MSALDTQRKAGGWERASTLGTNNTLYCAIPRNFINKLLLNLKKLVFPIARSFITQLSFF